ncbi:MULTISPECIES: hypothetical protein [unclassified Streptomyces]|uniref:hypothetical protein n=1 Tax=unclassified Streptomyces TaxID=2593676 RepID=UPI0037FDFA06
MRSLTRASIDPERFSAFAAAFAEGDAPEQWACYRSSLISDPDRVLAALTERQGERCRSGSTPSGKTTSQPAHPPAGIDRDRDAVIAGLTLPWNSGVVEGHVNRIKMLKRQMFGRAGFDLLRKRVLLYS